MKLIIDTDIGDDWDDVFTLAVAVASPEADLLGITTVAGDVGLRARLTRRLLALAGRDDVPVAIGAPTPSGCWASRCGRKRVLEAVFRPYRSLTRAAPTSRRKLLT